ncbi:hypothetical protein BLAT2472_150032 [Burkholderia latens]
MPTRPRRGVGIDERMFFSKLATAAPSVCLLTEATRHSNSPADFTG